jgi:hypothetical protein
MPYGAGRPGGFQPIVMPGGSVLPFVHPNWSPLTITDRNRADSHLFLQLVWIPGEGE